MRSRGDEWASDLGITEFHKFKVATFIEPSSYSKPRSPLSAYLGNLSAILPCMHVELETLREKPTLGTQINELDALKSTGIDCIRMACMRLDESFLGLDESVCDPQSNFPFLLFRVGRVNED